MYRYNGYVNTVMFRFAYTCISICIPAYVRMYTCVCTYIHIHIHILIPIPIPIPIPIHIHIHIHVYMRVCMCVYVQYKHVFLCVNICFYIVMKLHKPNWPSASLKHGCRLIYAGGPTFLGLGLEKTHLKLSVFHCKN